MRILAIDPGSEESAYVLMRDDYSIEHGSKCPNMTILQVISEICDADAEELVLVIEMVASYGMPVGREVFDTCVWIGRFTERGLEYGAYDVEYVTRMQEKMNLCHNSRARDSNIRQALIDRLAAFDRKSGKGTKAHPDVFYGFKKDMWAAAAVAVTWLDERKRSANG